MLKWVIDTTELNSGVKYFLRGCLDAAMASDISTLGFGAIAPLLFDGSAEIDHLFPFLVVMLPSRKCPSSKSKFIVPALAILSKVQGKL